MSGSLNKVMVIGNVGRDPEIRYTNDGRPVANLSVATTDTWKDQSGARQEKTEWHRITVFGGLAEVVEKYLKKGDPVFFEGRLQTRKWTGNDGQEKYTTEIIVDQRGGAMQMLSRRGDGAGGRDGYNQDDGYNDAPPSPKAKPARPAADDEPFDDDIPF